MIVRSTSGPSPSRARPGEAGTIPSLLMRAFLTFLLVLLLPPAFSSCGGSPTIEREDRADLSGEEDAPPPAPKGALKRPKTRPGGSSRPEEAVAEAALPPKDSREEGMKPAGVTKPAAAQTAAQKTAALIADLKDPDRADEAFRRIWSVPRSMIPELIQAVEDPALTQVERIQVLILDPDFVEHGKGFLANRIHGLGPMEVVKEGEPGDLHVVSQAYTKMSYGIAGKHYRVVLDKFGGFPVGVVVRAGLINRFRSTRYPAATDDDPAPGKLIAWWQEFYR